MNKYESVKILRKYNEWRKGADSPMQNPVVISEAIDTAIELLEQNSIARIRVDYIKEQIKNLPKNTKLIEVLENGTVKPL